MCEALVSNYCSYLEFYLHAHVQIHNAHSRMYLHTPSTLHQTSVDTVEVLLKKHEEFEGTSSAHDDRIHSEQANKLIHAGHYDTARYSMEKIRTYV